MISYCSATSAIAISMAPRAFMPKPTAHASRAGIPLQRAASPQPRTLPRHAIANTITTSGRLKFATKSVRRPRLPKKSGANTTPTSRSSAIRRRGDVSIVPPITTPARNAPISAP